MVNNIVTQDIELQRKKVDIELDKALASLINEIIEWSRLDRRLWQWRLSLATGADFRSDRLFSGNGHRYIIGVDVSVD